MHNYICPLIDPEITERDLEAALKLLHVKVNYQSSLAFGEFNIRDIV